MDLIGVGQVEALEHLQREVNEERAAMTPEQRAQVALEGLRHIAAVEEDHWLRAYFRP
jgi:hypothetical protein